MSSSSPIDFGGNTAAIRGNVMRAIILAPKSAPPYIIESFARSLRIGCLYLIIF
jgi:hypothetical protein